MENKKIVHMLKEIVHLTVYYFNISWIHLTPACLFEISLSDFFHFQSVF